MNVNAHDFFFIIQRVSELNEHFSWEFMESINFLYGINSY